MSEWIPKALDYLNGDVNIGGTKFCQALIKELPKTGKELDPEYLGAMAKTIQEFIDDPKKFDESFKRREHYPLRDCLHRATKQDMTDLVAAINEVKQEIKSKHRP